MQAVPVVEDLDQIVVPAGDALLLAAAQGDLDFQVDVFFVQVLRIDEVHMDIQVLIVVDGPDLLQNGALLGTPVDADEQLVALGGRLVGETPGEIGTEEEEDGRVVVEPVDFLVDMVAAVPEVDHQVDDGHQLLLGGVGVGEELLGEFHVVRWVGSTKVRKKSVFGFIN